MCGSFPEIVVVLVVVVVVDIGGNHIHKNHCSVTKMWPLNCVSISIWARRSVPTLLLGRWLLVIGDGGEEGLSGEYWRVECVDVEPPCFVSPGGIINLVQFGPARLLGYHSYHRSNSNITQLTRTDLERYRGPEISMNLFKFLHLNDQLLAK